MKDKEIFFFVFFCGERFWKHLIPEAVYFISKASICSLGVTSVNGCKPSKAAKSL